MTNKQRQEMIVKFLKEKYPNIKKVNPYTDLSTMDEIKNDILDCGFFKNKYAVGISLINYVLMAQDKQVPRNFAKR